MSFGQWFIISIAFNFHYLERCWLVGLIHAMTQNVTQAELDDAMPEKAHEAIA